MSSPVDPWSSPPEPGAQPSYPPPGTRPRAPRHARPEPPEPEPDGWRLPPPHNPTPAPRDFTQPPPDATPAPPDATPAPLSWSAPVSTPAPSSSAPTMDEQPTQVHSAIPPIPPAEPAVDHHARRPEETGSPAAASDSERPASRRPSRRTLLLSLGLAGLLLVSLGGLAYLTRSGGDDAAPPTAAAPDSPDAPQAADSADPPPSAEPSPEPEPEPQIRLVAPKSLDGRARSTDSELKSLAAGLVEDLEAKVRSGNSTVGAFYGSFEDEDIIMVAAASGFVLNPEQELDATVKALASDLNVRKMSTISAGPLGGVAKCGDGSASDIPLGVCAWADEGSVGMIVMFSESASTARSDFVDIRAEIEKRS